MFKNSFQEDSKTIKVLLTKIIKMKDEAFLTFKFMNC